LGRRAFSFSDRIPFLDKIPCRVCRVCGGGFRQPPQLRHHERSPRTGSRLVSRLHGRGKGGAYPRAALARKSGLMESGPRGYRLRFAAGLSC
jgi:hypothetical protein